MTDKHGLDSLYAGLTSKQIPALDGVRMIAVFLVILYHFGFNSVPGGQGVMVFFVLSGFLITWLLLDEQETSGTVSLRQFYWRRTLRIFPAFYAFWFLLMAVVVLRDGGMPNAHAWSAFFYVSNYYSALHQHPVDGLSHTWSLGVEEQFYLLWPAVFLLCRGNLRRMTHVLIAVIACVIVHRSLLTFVFHVDESYIYSAFDTRVDQLMIGCLVAVLLKRRILDGLWTRACSHPVAPVFTVAVVILSMRMGPLMGGHFREAIGYTIQGALYGVLLVQLIALSSAPAWSWLNAAPVRFLGRISYPLYLYQQITMFPVRRELAEFPVFVQLVAAVALTVFVASCSYYVVERPFLRLKHRTEWLQRFSRRVATA